MEEGEGVVHVHESSTDRRVHAENEHVEVVRYERAGKWFVESKRDLPRKSVSLHMAARIAQDCVLQGGSIHFGLPGGGKFDRAVRGA